MSIQRQYYFSFVYLITLVVIVWAAYNSIFGPVSYSIDVEKYKMVVNNFTGVSLDLSGLSNAKEIEEKLEKEGQLKRFVKVGGNNTLLKYQACSMNWYVEQNNQNEGRQCKITHMDHSDYELMKINIEKIFEGPIIFGKHLFIQTLSSDAHQNYLENITSFLQGQEYIHTFNHRLSESQFEMNSRQYLKNPQPERLIEYLSASKYQRFCDYTNKQCINHIFFLLENYGKVMTKGDITIVSKQNLEVAVLDWLGFGFKSQVSQRFEIWGRIQLLRILKQYFRQINHLEYIMDRQGEFWIRNDTLKLLDDWSSQLYSILSFSIENFEKNFPKVWKLRIDQVKILTDRRVCQANLFPEDYKIGVYLPILIPVIYSLLFVLKAMLKFM